MKRLNKIKEENPEALEDPRVQDLVLQADSLQDLKVLYDTDGGKQLVKLLLGDVVSCVRQLSSTYRTAPDIELRSIIAKMDTSLTTAALLFNAKEGIDILDQELEEALRE
jgi:hypothetical protein